MDAVVKTGHVNGHGFERQSMLRDQQGREVGSLERRKAQFSENAIQRSECDHTGCGDLDADGLPPPVEVNDQARLEWCRRPACRPAGKMPAPLRRGR